MKTSKIFALAALLCVAAFAFTAQAAGLDLASLVSPEMAMGISMAGVAGMINYVQEGEVLTLTPAAAVPAGTGYLFGAALFGVAINPVVINTPGEFLCEGVVSIGKTSALAISVGDRLFWDPVNSVVNKTSVAQQCVGIAVEAAANPSSTVKMLLDCSVPLAT